MSAPTFSPVPAFVSDYPEKATTVLHLNLPCYCINCQRKAETTWLTPNFGPICRECYAEIEGLLRVQE